MALIIEDGTQVSGANSYVSLAEVRLYAAARGLSFPADDAKAEVQVVLAADYLNTALEGRYKGQRTDPAQAMAWPRSGVFIFGATTSLDDGVIPAQVKIAQCQMAIECGSTDFLPTSDGREVIREKVDVLETEYAPRGTSVAAPTPTKVLAILRPVMVSGFSLSTLRA